MRTFLVIVLIVLAFLLGIAVGYLIWQKGELGFLKGRELAKPVSQEMAELGEVAPTETEGVVEREAGLETERAAEPTAEVTPTQPTPTETNETAEAKNALEGFLRAKQAGDQIAMRQFCTDKAWASGTVQVYVENSDPPTSWTITEDQKTANKIRFVLHQKFANYSVVPMYVEVVKTSQGWKVDFFPYGIS